jgi:hypothetical protein
VAQRIEAITATMGVTVDEDMGPRLQNIPAGTATLFWIVPSAQPHKGSDADNFSEDNICVIFVMKKYDRQRTRATECLEAVQPIIEAIKQTIIDDMATGCQVLAGLDVSTLSTIPETGFYGDFAGWSLGFTLNT